MIRAGLLVLLAAAPAAAEGLVGQALCTAAWARVSDGLAVLGPVRSDAVRQDGDWCVVDGPVIDLQGQYLPDWHLDRLRFRGSALGWIAEGAGTPEGLDVVAEGLRLVVQTGDAQMDWLFAAQSRPNAIDAELSLAWDPAARVLRLEGLSIDFPGENLVQASGTVTGVDLSSAGAMQMSLTSFALTAFDARVTMHGLFEWYVLMTLGPSVLPPEGDVDAAFAGLQGDLKAFIGNLPGASFPAESKAAMVAFVDELPNPAGDLVVGL
ncbi:MAG: hypothetical protein ACKO2N_22540, partial [Tabrizicola sp.]